MAKRPPRRGRGVPQPPPGTKPAPENPNSTAETPVRNEVRKWEKRLHRAHKRYDAWAERFECKRLEQYYEGKQWKGLTEVEAAKKYVINFTFATVEAQLPTLLFTKPKVNVDARPSASQSPGSNIAGRATTIEQLLQTLIDDPDTHFLFMTDLSLRDAYSRFACVEVGYTGDFIDNPDAGRPVLDEHDEPVVDPDTSQPIPQPAQVLKPGSKEAIYVKRVPPQDVRVGPGYINLLQHNDWYAVGEWADLNDVKRNTNYSNTATLRASGRSRWEDGETEEMQHDRPTLEDDEQAGKVRLWHLYDLRLKVRHVIAEGHPKYLLKNEPCPFPKHAFLKFYEKADSFYPIPPIYNWISPQDEINESREMARVHRRRAIRRYLRDQSIKNVEFEKLETGEDMVVATVPDIQKDPLRPVQDAELGQGFWTELAATKDDFAVITGVSGEARATSEADTATQANIVNVRQQIRESKARTQVAAWLGEIARLMFLNVKEYMTLPVMVKKTIDPLNLDPKQLAQRVTEWSQVKAEDLADLNVDIAIDVTSLSPVAEDAQRAAWSVMLGLLTNPQMVMVLFEPVPEFPDQPSPFCRRTLALLGGIKNDSEVREIWRLGSVINAKLQLMMAATAAQKGGGAGFGGGMTPTMSLPTPGGGSGGSGQPAPAPGAAV